MKSINEDPELKDAVIQWMKSKHKDATLEQVIETDPETGEETVLYEADGTGGYKVKTDEYLKLFKNKLHED